MGFLRPNGGIQTTFKQALALVCALAFASQARAIIITYDDLAATPSGIPIPAGYAGYDWNNFLAVDGADYPLPNTGYTNGIVTPKNVAVNTDGKDSSLTPFAPATTFSLNSGYFTAAYYNGLPVTVQGFGIGNMLLYTSHFNVSLTTPTLETFDWTGLSEVIFSSLPPGLGTGTQTQFVLDNLDVGPSPITSVPEPANAALAIFFAAMAMGWLACRQKEPAPLARG